MTKIQEKQTKVFCLPCMTQVAIVLWLSVATLYSADVYARFKIIKLEKGTYSLVTGGHRHTANPSWYLPSEKLVVTAEQWSAWIDMTKWPLHGRQNREGGKAEWPSMKVSVKGENGVV